MSAESTTPTPRSPRPRVSAGVLTALACAVLLVVFAALSYSASLQKSATYDEPLHVLGGFMHRHYADFRINPEDPALFGWIVSLPNPKGALRVDLNSESYRGIVNEVSLQWPYIWLTLYRTAGNDEQLVLNRSRAVCTFVGVILGAVIAWWSYRLAGPVAAVGATALYALCPNFLAHASIVKNDVPLSCVLISLMFTLWLVGRRASWMRLAAVALLCGAALGIKYSGVLAGPLVVIALVTRAMLPQPWEFVRINLTTRLTRLAAATATCVVSALVAWVCVWAAYGFRFNPTPDPNVSFKMENLEKLAKIKELQASKIRATMEIEARGEPVTDPALLGITDDEIKGHRPAAIVRVILWLNEKRVLPQGWLAGFLYTYATTLVRSTYLRGEIQQIGWWYFFPLAMLYKTPLATLLAAIVAPVVVIAGKIAYGRRAFRRLDAWALVCVAVAPLLYGASAINADLNLGLRHILPVYPFVFVAVGVALAMAFDRWMLPAVIASAVIAMGLMIETAAAYPDFIAFFNVAAGGSRGGYALLGDSNLDWGQDLKALARWQKENPSKHIYLSYFGVADPESYGVKASHLHGGYIFAPYAGNPPQIPDPNRPGVLAIGATNLQGIYLDEQMREAYRQILKHEPIEVLGGSIYLFEWPLTKATLREPDEN